MDRMDENIGYPDCESGSSKLFDRAQSSLPSGNSRHSIFFEPYPVYAASGSGAYVVDVDGIKRIDCVNNYTSLIHGHCHPQITAAVHSQIDRLSAVGLPTESEIALAEHLCGRIRSVDRLRFANSGTEAVMMGIKAARAYSGRSKIAKVEGCYHGSYDFAEISQTSTPENWGEGGRPASVAASAGEPQSVLDEVIVLPWNDVEAARALIRANASTLAGVLIDPMPSRVGMVPIQAPFAKMIQEECKRNGILFILDEVFSLRLGYGGAQQHFNLDPDLTCMAKIIGGGYPVGAIGGRADVMAVFGIEKGSALVKHGGTYNANPVTMVAGLEAMRLLTEEAIARLSKLGDRLRSGLSEAIKLSGIAAHVVGQGSLSLLILSDRHLESYRDLRYLSSRRMEYIKIHQNFMNAGVLTTPSLLFALSTAMTEADIDFIVEKSLGSMRDSNFC